MRLPLIAALLPMVLAGCAPEPPPSPPAAVAAAAARRPAPRPAAPPASRTEARPPADTVAAQRLPAAAATEQVAPAPPSLLPDVVIERPAPVETVQEPAPVPPPAAPVAGYRVRTDGVVGCADAQGLRLLNQLKHTPGVGPRLLAQAHRDGRCMTAFTNRIWLLTDADGGLVRLRLPDQEGGRATPLWFMRDEVVAAAP